MFLKKAFFTLFVFIAVSGFFAPILANYVNAQTTTPTASTSPAKLSNPIKATSFLGLIETLLAVVWKLGIPVIVLAIIYTGWLFVVAQGNPKKLDEAKKTLYWVIIGATLILGSYILAKAIAGTIQQLQA